MDAGRLQHRIRIDKPSVTRSASGDEVLGFAEFACVWAEIKPLRGRQLFASDQIQADVDTRIAVRWSPEIDAVGAKFRVVFGRSFYDVQAAIHVDMARDEVQFYCKSGRNEG